MPARNRLARPAGKTPPSAGRDRSTEELPGDTVGRRRGIVFSLRLLSGFLLSVCIRYKSIHKFTPGEFAAGRDAILRFNTSGRIIL